MDSFTSVEEKICLQASQAGMLLTVGFELTPVCNMECKMCYIRHTKAEQEKECRLRTVEEWLGAAKDLQKQGALFLLLTGGEPLLYPGFLRLYKELKKMGFIITINTNGTLLTEEIVDVFAKDKPRRINVTLYGASSETYLKVTKNPKGFEQVMRGLGYLKECGIPVKLNCSMVRENMNDTLEILDIAENLGMPLEYNTYMFPCSRRSGHHFREESRVSPEEAAKWGVYIRKRQKKERFPLMKEKVLYAYKHADEGEAFGQEVQCRAGKSSAWINWKGRMTPCVFLEEPSMDVVSNRVEEAWCFIKEECGKILLPKECGACKHRFQCNVCAACTKWESGDFSGKPVYLCEYMDEVVKQLMADSSSSN